MRLVATIRTSGSLLTALQHLLSYISHSLSVPESAITMHLLSSWTTASAYQFWSSAPPLTADMLADALEKCVMTGDGIVVTVPELTRGEMLAFRRVQAWVVLSRGSARLAEAAAAAKSTALVVTWNLYDIRETVSGTVSDIEIAERIRGWWIVVAIIAVWTWMTSLVGTRRTIITASGGVEKGTLLPVAVSYRPLPQSDECEK